MNLVSICEQAIDITKEAGKFIAKERENFDSSRIEFKGSHTNMVSYVDQEAEKILVKGLKKIFPEAGFITEEETETIKGERYNWIIDPLDGTTNFLHNIPCYCVSVALEDKGKVIAGIIYDMNANECFHATKGNGAFMNGKAISVSNVSTVEEAVIATGFPYKIFDKFDNHMQIIRRLVESSHGVRRFGSAAIDMAYVACGRLDGYYEFSINSWDIAAGIILIQEAGGIVTDFRGGDDFLFSGEIIVGSAMQPKLLALIEEDWKK
ncbi:MAG: inositol monophosphatase family protein [Cyclobacteriaceae bacterium]